MSEAAPLKITLYDPETSEVKATFSRSFIPWSLFKKAVRIGEKLKGANEINEDLADELAGLVAEAFGNQFSIDDLNQGADLGEMMTVLNQIINRAGAAMPNPTRPG